MARQSQWLAARARALAGRRLSASRAISPRSFSSREIAPILEAQQRRWRQRGKSTRDRQRSRSASGG